MHIAIAADHRYLRDDAFHALVDRGYLQHMPAGVAGAPDADAVLIDLGQAAGIGDRVPVVADRVVGVDLKPGLTVAVSEIAVIVDEDGEAVLDEDLGVLVEEHLLGAREAVRHDDRGNWLLRAVRHVEPSTKS